MKHKKKSSIFTTRNIIITILAIALILSIFTKGFTNNPINLNKKEAQITGHSFLILNDERCTGQECDTTQIKATLEQMFPSFSTKTLDYNTEEGQELYNELNLEKLPAILFSPAVENATNYNQISQYVEQKGDYLNLMIGATHDPEAEICDNEIDDNNNNLVDCDDPDCSSEWQCMPKSDNPEVELFIMSYCPYGTQAQKGMIPVMETLGDKADIKIKWVDYIMHGAKEIDENLIQYCIQKGQPALYLDYIKCFLEEGKSDECIQNLGINTDVLAECIQEADEEYQISTLYNDKETWAGGQFPQFNVHQDLNEKYGVRGSPTLVINGVTANVGRSPAELLDAVCTAFKEKPEECNTKLSTTTPTAGFGFDSSGSTAEGTC